MLGSGYRCDYWKWVENFCAMKGILGCSKVMLRNRDEAQMSQTPWSSQSGGKGKVRLARPERHAAKTRHASSRA